jgi:hypothetical protein
MAGTGTRGCELSECRSYRYKSPAKFIIGKANRYLPVVPIATKLNSLVNLEQSNKTFTLDAFCLSLK